MAGWLATKRDLAALAAAWAGPTGQVSAAAWQLPLAEQYRRLFAPPEPPAVMAGAEAATAAALRYREAADRFGEHLSAVAHDAGRRLASALADSGPHAPPITTLRELHALWVECGDAAWSAAAYGEAFAAAQAELLVALVELRATGTAP
jgi:hypothetical protein